jgi:hypothetical protein
MNRQVTVVKNDTGPDLTVVIVKNDDNQKFVTSPGNVYLNIRRKDTTTNIVTIQADSLKSLGTQAQYTFGLRNFMTHADVTPDFYEAEVEFIVPDGTDEQGNPQTATFTTFEQITIQVRDDYT